ncbi:helix-turn-helix domain-containing protein [Azospirillum sp. ST 5-10]|uniref:helix-turn-helix domain-containing protein n=1 Tax=unclassified Azospirillum TaxID=2630922 RepID=UPI003F4A4A7C
MDDELRRALARLPVLAPLAAEDRDRLLGYSAERRLAGDVTLFRAGDPAGAVFLVLEGRVVLDPGGTAAADTAAEPLEAGDLVGTEALLAGARRAATVRTRGPARLLEIPAPPLSAHLETRFEAVLALLAGASAGLRGMIHEITELKLRSTTHRLANYLLGLAGPEGGGLARIVLPCEKSELAERLGMKPESLSRAFAKLRAHGVHSSRGGTVVLKEPDTLRAFCGGAGNGAGDEEAWP